jgi:hypothetical protein
MIFTIVTVTATPVIIRVRMKPSIIIFEYVLIILILCRRKGMPPFVWWPRRSRWWVSPPYRRPAVISKTGSITLHEAQV